MASYAEVLKMSFEGALKFRNTFTGNLKNSIKGVVWCEDKAMPVNPNTPYKDLVCLHTEDVDVQGMTVIKISASTHSGFRYVASRILTNSELTLVEVE